MIFASANDDRAISPGPLWSAPTGQGSCRKTQKPLLRTKFLLNHGARRAKKQQMRKNGLYRKTGRSVLSCRCISCDSKSLIRIISSSHAKSFVRSFRKPESLQSLILTRIRRLGNLISPLKIVRACILCDKCLLFDDIDVIHDEDRTQINHDSLKSVSDEPTKTQTICRCCTK